MKVYECCGGDLYEVFKGDGWPVAQVEVLYDMKSDSVMVRVFAGTEVTTITGEAAALMRDLLRNAAIVI